MANETLIEDWVSDKLAVTGNGFSVARGNLIRQSVESLNKELYDAMAHSSKLQNGKRGVADFTFFVTGAETNDRYLVLIETKDDTSNIINVSNGQLLMDIKSTRNYAVNGAVWYGKQIQKETNLFPKIFVIGVAGDYNRQSVIPYFVNETGAIIELPKTNSFQEFGENNIDEYYRVNVEKKIPKSEMDGQKLAEYANQLHKDIRNYSNLKDSDKAPLIASILLAIHSKNLTLGNLMSSPSQRNNDGVTIYNAVAEYLDKRKSEEPEFDDGKIQILLDTFSFIKSNAGLYKPLSELNGRSPLYKFTSELFEVYNTVKIGEDIDLLGDFYSEFVKYGNSDGNVLGIVLTPKHITGLMADLIQLGKDNYLLDPTTGSASFLVSGMNRMVKQIPKDENYENSFKEVVTNHLHGVELDPQLYSVAVSNMILRGDGKSNVLNGNFFDYELVDKLKASKDIYVKRITNGLKGSGLSDNEIKSRLSRDTIYSNFEKRIDNVNLLKSKARKIDRILMNPPYSQGKKAPEINFIRHALEIMDNGGKMAVIVPISVFVSGGKGVKTKEFKDFKKFILKDYVVESIITMNPQTFYPTGTQTVIAIIRKNVGIGQKNRRTKLINFIDDGYSVVPKKGLIPNGTHVEKYQHLIDVVVNDDDAPNEFMLKVQLTEENEWIHNAHYTNPDHPTDADFMNAVADYVSFKQDMILHGRGDLFND